MACFVACGNDNDSVSTEEPIIEETVEEVEPLSEDDFLVVFDNGNKEENLIQLLDEENVDQDSFHFFYYDPNYDESKEGVVKTHRGVVIGDSKERVLELYGEGKCGDFDKDNDFCYELSKGVELYVESDISDVSSAMSAQCVSFVRYTYINKYTISFYFDEDEEVSWIFITKKA